MTTRRTILSALSAAGAVALADPRAAFAAAPGERRLVVAILRGGMDGLEAVAPYADADYRRLRPTLAAKPPGEKDGAVDLDGRFGLSPALAPLHALYKSGELLIAHAIGSPDRTRSHFDAQDTLENGGLKARDHATGWLNRALAILGGGRERGLAVAHNVPLLMRGPVAVRTWAPAVLPEADAAFLDRLDIMYARDPQLLAALRAGRRSAAAADKAMGGRPKGMGGPPNKAFVEMAGAAGKLLSAADGPRIASIEMDGWDTHFGQAFNHRQQLDALARGLIALKDALGPAWQNTVVIAASEFGRTAAENGTRGTDHGTGGAAFLAGGAVAGGRIIGRWPGLAGSQLFEKRDLAATTDLRALFKGVLREHMRMADAALEDRVFPGSRAAVPIAGLIKRS
jgi:uncharacterized protein (DUF1501 family)